MPVEYVLDKPSVEPVVAPVLDDSQRAVIEHMTDIGGPLQVLAGPGAGKTTTLVELVVDRIEQGGLSPDEVLVLTFSRKAAQELRARIARRLARTTATTAAMTFHSFCYALLRSEQDASGFAQPLRLLSAPEQDAVISEVLAGTDPEQWPAAMRPALRTRGLASELRTLIAAARANGMDDVDLLRVADSAGRGDWRAAAEFFDELTAVAALAHTIDHTDLIFEAVKTLNDPAIRDRWRSRLRLIVVDEYQDTDPLQVELLQALAGDGRDLVVVGDPYQSIYGFRGADVRGIIDFPDQFATAAGPAPRLTLGYTNRYGTVIAAAVRSVVDKRGALGAVDGTAFEALRSPTSRASDPGSVQVGTFSSPTAEAEHIALLLRQAHLHDGVPWRDMAVLVRSGLHLGRLQRALTAAGVPVEVAGDELPLAAEPAVRTLLAALHAADALNRGEHLAPDVAHALLTGPLGHLDAAAVRRLGRALRKHAAAAGEQPRASRLLIAEAIGDPVFLSTLDTAGPTSRAVDAAARLAALLRTAADQISTGESAEQVLWTVWDGTRWPTRLQADAESDGDGAPQANHDLDAVCALFAEAARAEERDARRSVTEVTRALEEQQIPGDTIAQSGDSGEAVQVMTAHRSKGLEWPLVVVAAVQDGEWPDVRGRGSLLQGDRLSRDGVLPPPSPWAAAAEERRLFYVACSRARSRLVVTAVASGSDEGDQPSRFLGELHAHVNGESDRRVRTLPSALARPTRTLSLRGAIAELRRIGESTTDPEVRERVAARLAQLATVPAARSAHPDRWWGLAERTTNDTPLRDPDEPLQLSGSQMDRLSKCTLQWFLNHEAKGERGTSAAQGFGSIVHALAAQTFLDGVEPDVDEMAAHLDDVWGVLGLPEWISAREREAAIEALGRFVQWHRSNPREVIAVEHAFNVVLDVDGRDVRLTGSMDRVELGDDGVHVIDLKTSKNPPSGPQVATNAQLGLYQVAVDAGATSELAPGAGAAGAELVQLRTDAPRTVGVPKVQPQPGPSPEQPFFAVEQLRQAVRDIGAEQLSAVRDDKEQCKYCDFTHVCPARDSGASILGGQA
ncbi:ATP-dependent helicase [Aeromicrobium ginsengisoli]|uniref:DNA 3'-5' helicase n=1 Tax=Aeromicrobium ginsengisoli TaxID=363867 RepID=A0A5M4FEE4_9ACTN|nr:ATP-dependent DNA helicase [Aeromicrobium ginsengisoli]KAA1397589.1 ATP-dependent helicase [Aeromicrobium ginsengisoli]